MRVNAARRGTRGTAGRTESGIVFRFPCDDDKKNMQDLLPPAPPLSPVRDSTFILGAINALFCLRYASYQFPYIPIYLFG